MKMLASNVLLTFSWKVFFTCSYVQNCLCPVHASLYKPHACRTV